MTTSVTIASAKKGSNNFTIPSGFFFNAQALGTVVDDGIQELVILWL
jgi:hypothetical protein